MLVFSQGKHERVELTPMPVIAGFEAKLPNSTDPTVQLMAGSNGYLFAHSTTEVAVPMLTPSCR